MPPIAVETPVTSNGGSFAHASFGSVSATNVSVSGSVLVIGSMAAAQSGAYQKAVEACGQNGQRQVEMHMVDRITDGATTLPSSAYPLAHLVVPYAEASSQKLLAALLEALQPGGQVVVEAAELFDEVAATKVRGELSIAGFVDARSDSSTGIVSATKSADATPAPAVSLSSAPSGSTALPLRRKIGGGERAKKAALWATKPAGSGSGLIDQSTLLTSADYVTPTAVKRPDCDVGPGASKKKKACKGCTCGLKEQQDAEDAAAAAGQPVVQLDEADMDMPNGTKPGGTRTEVTETIVGRDGVERTVKRIQVDTKGATSSCGSCFLGDAFRCSSCPFLGLPAFEPGQKVEIPAGMDDDI